VAAFGGDPWLVLAAVALIGLGVVMVFNVSYFFAQDHFGDPLLFFRKHLLSIGLGLAAGVLTSRLSSDTYRRLAYPLLLGVLAALVLVLVPGIGIMRGGARRWLHLGPLTLQPSEVAKFALVLFLARSVTKKGPRVREFTLGIVPHCLVGGVLAALVLLEHDFGTAALAVSLLIFMLFAGGVRLWHLGALGIGTVPLLGLGLVLAPYRIRRLAAFLSPDQDPLGMGHQLRQSLIGFGSGGLWGVGLGESQQKMFFLPAAHTDFIFSVIGEELGLAGALLVVALFAAVAARGFRIAVRHPDEFASLLAFGTTLLLVLQGAINMAVVLGCLPTKGLTLPFVSYGGSAMVAVLAETGVLLALAREAG
jgi:cell division protein FtsW